MHKHDSMSLSSEPFCSLECYCEYDWREISQVMNEC